MSPNGRNGPSSGRLQAGVVRVFGDSRLATDGDILAAFLAEESIWSVEEHGIVREWSVTTGRQRRQRCLGEVEPLWVFCPDGQRLAAAGRELVVFDLHSGRELGRAKLSDWATALSWSGEGRWLATGHENGLVYVWQSEPLRLWQQMRSGRQPISAVAFSIDGELLAAADEAGRLAIYHRSNGERLAEHRWPTGRIATLVWHPQRTWIISAGWDSYAHVWQPTESEPVALFNAHDECVTALAISLDGSILATGDSAGILRLWAFDSRRLLHELSASVGPVTIIAFDRTGRKVLSSGEDRRLVLWDVAQGKPILGCGLSAASRLRLAYSEASGQIALAAGRTVQLFDVQGHQPPRSLEHPHGAMCVAWIDAAGLLLTGDGMGTIHHWAMPDGQWQGCWQEHRTAIADLDWHEAMQHLASAGGEDGYVYLWRLGNDTPTLLVPDAALGATAETVRLLPRFHGLLVGGVDWLAERHGAGALVWWDIHDWKPRLLLRQGVLRLTVRRDGQRALVSNLQGTAWLLELPSGRILSEIIGHSEPVLALAFHPRTGEILTASEDHLLCSWTSDGRPLASTDLEVSVHDVAFAENGEYIFTANGNSTVFQVASSILGFGRNG
ncbi:MAG: WD40 repeat domain-containing protein [Gemmatales bacterium]|nr:WD40 repeat domain-containing protein [Gemmatales bacterium]MDW7995605.1 WD40 repeat domain-containing protein [Gemmatales bacterium]